MRKGKAALLQRAPGVSVILRDELTIQFGVDATRAGLITLASAGIARKVARSLADLDGALSQQGLADALATAGLDPAAAHNLSYELVRYGLWREVDNFRTVVVWGTSPLASAIAQGLSANGFRVRTTVPELAKLPASVIARYRAPLSPNPQGAEFSLLEHGLGAHMQQAATGKSGHKGPLSAPTYTQIGAEESAYLRMMDHKIPLIVVDCLHKAHALSSLLLESPRTWIPVTGLDTRVLVGPLHKSGSGPCILCLNLYRTELDPEWPRIMDLIAGHWPQLDHSVVSAAITQVTLAARYLYSLAQLPGASPVRWMPGQWMEVDPFGGDRTSYHQPHPNCPVCFSAATGSLSSLFSSSVNAPF